MIALQEWSWERGNNTEDSVFIKLNTRTDIGEETVYV